MLVAVSVFVSKINGLSNTTRDCTEIYDGPEISTVGLPIYPTGYSPGDMSWKLWTLSRHNRIRSLKHLQNSYLQGSSVILNGPVRSEPLMSNTRRDTTIVFEFVDIYIHSIWATPNGANYGYRGPYCMWRSWENQRRCRIEVDFQIQEMINDCREMRQRR